MHADWAELEAIREGLEWAWRHNVTRLILESDSAAVVNRLKNTCEDISIFGIRVKEVQLLFDSFVEANVRWTNRMCNRVCSLSKMALSQCCTF